MKTSLALSIAAAFGALTGFAVSEGTGRPTNRPAWTPCPEWQTSEASPADQVRPKWEREEMHATLNPVAF